MGLSIFYKHYPMRSSLKCMHWSTFTNTVYEQHYATMARIKGTWESFEGSSLLIALEKMREHIYSILYGKSKPHFALCLE